MVGVVQQLVGRVAATERHHQRGDDEVGGLAFAHRPADEGVVVQVADAGEVELAVNSTRTRRCPRPIADRSRSAVKSRCSRSGAGDHRGVTASTPLAAAVSADQALGSHQPGDPVVARPDALGGAAGRRPRGAP